MCSHRRQMTSNTVDTESKYSQREASQCRVFNGQANPDTVQQTETRELPTAAEYAHSLDVAKQRLPCKRYLVVTFCAAPTNNIKLVSNRRPQPLQPNENN